MQHLQQVTAGDHANAALDPCHNSSVEADHLTIPTQFRPCADLVPEPETVEGAHGFGPHAQRSAASIGPFGSFPHGHLPSVLDEPECNGRSADSPAYDRRSHRCILRPPFVSTVRRSTVGLPILGLVGLAALGVPRVVLHDLHLIGATTPVTWLLAIGPVVLWIVAVVAAKYCSDVTPTAADSPTVRRAQPADAEVVAQLLWDFNTEFESPVPGPALLTRRFADLLQRNDVLVMFAEIDAAVVGFAYLTYRPTPYFDGPIAQLEELYLQPDRRDQGIGTLLLQRVLDEVHQRGSGELHINVDEIDTDTRRFYERHGFSNIEPGQDYRMLFYLREL